MSSYIYQYEGNSCTLELHAIRLPTASKRRKPFKVIRVAEIDKQCQNTVQVLEPFLGPRAWANPLHATSRV